MGKIKIKHRNPKRNEFTPNDIVINVKNGTLFYKSNFAIYRLQGVLTTKLSEEADTIVQNIEAADDKQILFNNNGVQDGDSLLKYTFTDDGQGGLSNQVLEIGAPTKISNHLNLDTNISEATSGINLGLADPSIISNPGLKITTSLPGGYTEIGSLNGIHSNFLTDHGGFNFNKRLITNEGIISSNYGDMEVRTDNSTSTSKGRIICKSSTAEVECKGDFKASGTGVALGKVLADNDIIAFASDEKLKTNIINIPDPLKKIRQLRGVYYDWEKNINKKGFYPERKTNEIGMVAQEVEKIIPQAIAPAPFNKEYKTIKYDRIIPLLVECINEQQKQIDELKNKING